MSDRWTVARGAALVCLVALLCVHPTVGTHFRFNTINWSRDPNDLSTVRFEIQQAWRYTFYYPTLGVAETVTGDVNWGNGVTGLSLIPVEINTQQDWFIGTASIDRTYDLSTITGPTTVLFSSCCRISTLEDNNQDKNYLVRARLDLTNDNYLQGPLLTNVPIVTMVQGAFNNFFIPAQPASEPAGENLVYEIVTDENTGLQSPYQPQGHNLNSATGEVTWTPSTTGSSDKLFAVQVKVSQGDVLYSTIDYIYRVVSLTNNNRPLLRIIRDGLPDIEVGTQSQIIEEAFFGNEVNFQIQAEDIDIGGDDDTRVRITSNALPSFSSFSQCAEGNDGAGYTIPSSSNPGGRFCTRRFRWTPQLGQRNLDLLFFATDGDGIDSAIMRVTIEIGTARILYISGIIRNFNAGSQDFERTSNGDVGPGFRLVSPTIGTDAKPVYSPSSTPSTVASAASFDRWWARHPDNNNQEFVHSLTLSNAGTNNGNVFSFKSTAFYPTGPSNTQFTYAINTFITYKGGEIFEFESSDDLWVFVNGQLKVNLGGVHDLTTGSVNLDTDFNPPLVVDGDYAFDLFFAHRHATREPKLQVQSSDALLCNVLTSGEVSFADVDYPTTNGLQLNGNAAIIVDPNGPDRIRISRKEDTFFSATVYKSVLERVLNGFNIEFDYVVDIPNGQSCEGFAVVVQRQDVGARGAAGNNLGYRGITNSLAIEFDMKRDPELGDSNGNHVSVHTKYALENSANELDAVANNTAAITLDDGAVHHVQITYVPAKIDQNTAQQTTLFGWVRVYIDGDIVPAVSGQVLDNEVRAMLNGAAWVGFSSSTGALTSACDIDVFNWKLDVVPPSSEFTSEVSQPAPIFAGETGQFEVQARDACRNDIILGGELSRFSFTLVYKADNSITYTPVAGDIQDQQNGKYTFFYPPRRAGVWTLSVFFASLELDNSPYEFNVAPGPISALTSFFDLPTQTMRAGETYTFTVQARDFFNNDRVSGGTGGGAGFSMVLLDAVTSTVQDQGDGTYVVTWSIQRSSSQHQIYVKYNGQDIVNSPTPATVLAAPASNATSQMGGVGLFSASADSTGFVQITPFDRFGNKIENNNGDSITVTLVNGPGGASAACTGMTFNLATLNYECLYSATVAGDYQMHIVINGDNLTNPYTPRVTPGEAVAARSFITDISNTVFSAGSLMTMTVQTVDQHGNIRDAPTGFPISSRTEEDTATVIDDSSSFLINALVYDGSGQYKQTYTPRLASDTGGVAHNLYAQLAGVDVRNNGGSRQVMPVRVRAGPPNAAESDFAHAAGDVTAGQNASFTITSRDQYRNVRNNDQFDFSNDATVFVNTILGPSAQGTVQSANPVGSTNQYNVLWRATVAEEYEVATKLFGTTVGTPADIQVVPDVTDAVQSVATGQFGGNENANNTFSILARDQFGNQQIQQDDKWRVTVVNADDGATYSCTSDSADSNCAVVPSSNGRYTVWYIVPTAGTASRFNLTVELGTGPFEVAQQVVDAPIFTVALPDNYAWPVLPITGVAGAENSFLFIDDEDAGESFSGRVSQPYSTQITLTTDPAVDIASRVIDNGGGNYTGTFSGTIAGEYTLRIFWSVTQESLATSLPLNFTLLPGPVDGDSTTVAGFPAVMIAGATSVFTVTLRDRFNNRYPTLNANSGAISPVFSDAAFTTQGISAVGQEEYHISYTSTKASASPFTMSVNFNNAINLGALALYQILVQPAALDANNSIANGPGTSAATAGQAAFFTVTIRDFFDNPINDNSQVITMSISAVNVALASTYIGTANDPGKYSVSYTPQTAGPNQPLVVNIGGEPIFQILNVDIAPADISVNASSVTGISGQVGQAGTPFTFTVTARDQFNNLIDDVVLDVTYSGNGSALGDANVASVGNVVNGGEYPVTFTPLRSGDFTFSINTRAGAGQSGTPLSNMPGNVLLSVNSGPTVPANSIIPSLQDMTAGGTQEFQVITRDAQNNINTAGGDTIAIRFVKNRALCGQIPNPAGEGTVLADPLVYVDELFDWSVADHPSGIGYLVSFSANSSGPYSVNVTVNDGEALDCNDFRLFVVTPAAASGLFSEITGTGTTETTPAGGRNTLTIEIKDRFGNKIGNGGDTVLVGRTPTVPTTTVLPPQSEWLRDANSFVSVQNLTDLGTGFYLLSFTATRSGSLRIVATVNGELIEDEKYAQVGAGTIWTFFPPAVGIVVAGFPNNYLLSGFDEYGNPVQNFDHNWQNVFNRGSGQGGVDEYVIRKTGNITSTPGVHRVDYTPHWHGQYTLTITIDDGKTFPDRVNNSRVLQLQVEHATCAFTNASTPFRCPDRTCVASYSDCAGVTVCNGNGLVCAGGSTCQLDGTDCPLCSVTAPVACSLFGKFCIPTGDSCPVPSGVCPDEFPHQCSSDECRKTAADCPTFPTCAPGYVLCYDGFSCARDAASCPALNSGSCAAGVRCPDGKCVQDITSCATRVTCKNSTQVLCPDGSCRASSDKCPDQYVCFEPTPLRCPDGSCRTSYNDCPSRVVCPSGWVKCEGGTCADSAANCPLVAQCGDSQVRCADGSCKANVLLCPTMPTCPVSRPVLCPDLSCVDNARDCEPARTCTDPATQYQCFNMECVSDPSLCAPSPTCPQYLDNSYPVLCPDGSCVTSSALCTAEGAERCPTSTPHRCLDGSCRLREAECPSRAACPAVFPVRCPDGSCQTAGDQCASPALLECPANTVRCPQGGCAGSKFLCSTGVTCPSPTVRCVDGSCRSACPDIQYEPCPVGQVTCPQTHGGPQCAASLSQCPVSITCPDDRPVKCVDMTCAVTLEDCVPLGDFQTDRVLCSDHGWQGSIGGCGTPTTCRDEHPYRCWDDSCRVVPEDCPPVRQCPPATPFLCATGNCVANLDDCRSGIFCDDDKPVKCQNGLCVEKKEDCPLYWDLTQDDRTSCANGGTLCRSGSCRSRDDYCSTKECPTFLPHLCPDGSCAVSSAECPNNEGCHPWVPYRCSNGQCATSPGACSNNATATCPSGDILCWSGVCKRPGDCPPKNNCPDGDTRCADGECVPTREGEDNECLAREPDGNVHANECPFTRPIRCPDGYCAVSSVWCGMSPVDPALYPCPSDRPIFCASGDCVRTAEHCPLIIPCKANEQRCGDGTCRSVNSNAENPCPQGGDTCGASYKRCDGPGEDGRCILNVLPCRQINGCPDAYTKCAGNGACCTGTDCSATECTTETLANGCPAGSPYKCNDRSCAADATSCPSESGCPAATPFRCPDGQCVTYAAAATTCGSNCTTVTCANGDCVANRYQCNNQDNCPLNTPYRCADGSCAAYPAVDFNESWSTALKDSVCKATQVCPGTKPVLCQDGSCAATGTLCPSRLPCTSPNNVHCPDGTCANSKANCQGEALNLCPPAASARCWNGACVASLRLCPDRFPSQTCSKPLVQCFDGSCAASPLDCATLQHEVQTSGGAFDRTASQVDGATCPSGAHICQDGSCVLSEDYCPPVAACSGDYPLRCPDGSCQATSCAGHTEAACSSGTRCEDGFCRPSCRPYQGCPLSAPYFCADSGACAANSAGCVAAVTGRRLLQLDVPTTTGRPCSQDCFRDTSVTFARQVIDPTTNPKPQNLELVVDDQKVARMTVQAPAGSVVRSSGTDPAQLIIRPATRSQLNGYQNFVTRTRQGQFGFNMDFAESVLSAPFTCEVTSNVQRPFNIPVVVTATVDTPSGDGGAQENRDICLARADATDNEWHCLVGETTAEREASPAWSENFGLKYTEVRGLVPDCDGSTPYAFIQRPLPSTDAASASQGDDFWQDNWAYVIALMCGIFLMLTFFTYGGSRLYRYRGKFHKERAKRKEVEEVIEEMEIVGGQASGNVDDDVLMTANPMVVQMQQVEGQLRHNESEQTHATQQGGDTAKIDELQSERDRLQAELARLKAEMAFAAQQQEDQHRVFSSPGAGYASSSNLAPPTMSPANSAGPTTFNQQMMQRQPSSQGPSGMTTYHMPGGQQRVEFAQAAKPKKKTNF